MGCTAGEIIMVNFSILNSKSTTFETDQIFREKFKDTLKLLKELKEKKYIDTVRSLYGLKGMEIIKGKTLEEFISCEQDIDFRRQLLSFISNKTINVEYPLVSEEEEKELGLQEYRYEDEIVIDMGYADIFKALLISFNSNEIWNKDKLKLEKTIMDIDGELRKSVVEIHHASTIEHITRNSIFANTREKEIFQELLENFEIASQIYFKKIKLSPDIFREIRRLDREVLIDAIDILYSLEIGKKELQEYNYSSESEGVKNNPALRELRNFKLPSGKKMYMFNHIKNLPKACRIYFHKESDTEIYIGYIGKHLRTVNY